MIARKSGAWIMIGLGLILLLLVILSFYGYQTDSSLLYKVGSWAKSFRMELLGISIVLELMGFLLLVNPKPPEKEQFEPEPEWTYPRKSTFTGTAPYRNNPFVMPVNPSAQPAEPPNPSREQPPRFIYDTDPFDAEPDVSFFPNAEASPFSGRSTEHGQTLP